MSRAVCFSTSAHQFSSIVPQSGQMCNTHTHTAPIENCIKSQHACWKYQFMHSWSEAALRRHSRWPTFRIWYAMNILGKRFINSQNKKMHSMELTRVFWSLNASICIRINQKYIFSIYLLACACSVLLESERWKLLNQEYIQFNYISH